MIATWPFPGRFSPDPLPRARVCSLRAVAPHGLSLSPPPVFAAPAVAVTIHTGNADDCLSAERKVMMPGWQTALEAAPANLLAGLVADGADYTGDILVQHAAVRKCVPQIVLRLRGSVIHESNVHY
jgi:hypothetical protein